MSEGPHWGGGSGMFAGAPQHEEIKPCPGCLKPAAASTIRPITIDVSQELGCSPDQLHLTSFVCSRKECVAFRWRVLANAAAVLRDKLRSAPSVNKLPEIEA